MELKIRKIKRAGDKKNTVMREEEEMWVFRDEKRERKHKEDNILK